jgi:hypothetical protein
VFRFVFPAELISSSAQIKAAGSWDAGLTGNHKNKTFFLFSGLPRISFLPRKQDLLGLKTEGSKLQAIWICRLADHA